MSGQRKIGSPADADGPFVTVDANPGTEPPDAGSFPLGAGRQPAMPAAHEVWSVASPG